MADKKPSGFRFRLPWLLQRPPTPAREPPRTATQTSVSSTSAQRPPFRPPGRAPVLAAPSMVATPAPASPRRSPPQSVPKSPIAETIEPVATQATKEIQTTTETVQTTETEPAKETQTTIETIPTAETPPRQPQSQQPTSPPQSPPQFRVSSLPDPVSPTHIRTPPQSVPKSPIAETIKPVATQATKETQTTTTETEPTKEAQTTTETIPTAETPPRQPQSQQPTSPPQSPPQFRVSPLPDPVSPTHIRTPPQTNSQPRSPTRMATPTNPSSPSPEASPPRAASQPSSPVHGQPSQKHTPPRSPSKTSSSPAIPEIKRSTDITKVKEAQTKSQRPKPITASTQVPLQREIKDDISKFIHKIATISTSKLSMNEQQQSVITIAGDNKGALMHLNSDAIKREIKQDSKLSENEEMKAIVNNNIQGINNSMMFNSSITERDPGVHLVITRNLLTNMNDSEMKNAESMEMQRAEFNVSPPQKLVYDPMIGRSVQGDFEPDDFETPPNSNEIEVL